MDEYKPETLDQTLFAVADPTRRAILTRLAREGDLRMTDVAARFPISLNSVSKHVKVLERAGLVRREVLGREHRIAFEGAPLVEASAWLAHMRAFWDARLDALEGFLTDPETAGAAAPEKDHG